MGPISCPETSVRNYYYSRRNNAVLVEKILCRIKKNRMCDFGWFNVLMTSVKSVMEEIFPDTTSKQRRVVWRKTEGDIRGRA